MTRVLNLFVVLLLSGCVTDISYDSRYHSDYVIGGVYEVKRRLIAYKSRAPLTIIEPKEYRLQDAKSFPMSIPGVQIEPGVLVRVTRLLRDRGSLGELTYWVKGEFMNGPLSGSPVELIFISIVRELPLVDKNILRYVSKP